MTDARPPENILVAGLGSHHGDDQAGWLMVEILQPLVQDHPLITIRRAAVPLDLIDWLDQVTVLHICDACVFDDSRDPFLRLTWPPSSGRGGHEVGRGSGDHVTSSAGAAWVPLLTRAGSRDTHGFGLPEVLALAEATGKLPPQVTLWCISASQFSEGTSMSAAVRQAVRQSAACLSAELRL